MSGVTGQWARFISCTRLKSFLVLAMVNGRWLVVETAIGRMPLNTMNDWTRTPQLFAALQVFNSDKKEKHPS